MLGCTRKCYLPGLLCSWAINTYVALHLFELSSCGLYLSISFESVQLLFSAIPREVLIMENTLPNVFSEKVLEFKYL